jgi:uncharacterized protein (TIGR03435 family)
MDPGGVFRAVNLDLSTLIANAYRTERRLLPFQIVNAPDWLSRERFDITAKSEATPGATVPPFAQLPVLVQTLLEDRFKLKVHRETRSLPIYTLITSRTAGQLGPSLRVSSTDCAKDPTQCGIKSAPGLLSAKALDMDTLITILAVPAQRMVVDRTGLAGRFDLELKWRPYDVRAGSSDDAPDFFSAVLEQLGLKLEPATGDVEVLVIDHVERPNEN